MVIIYNIRACTFFLLKKIGFDSALNFNQVDLPYPVWNRVNLNITKGIQIGVIPCEVDYVAFLL
jgi:hypothetical protein